MSKFLLRIGAAFILFGIAVQVSYADVVVHPGDTIQTAVDANPPGTTFTLKAGLYSNQTVTPKSGDSFIGEQGTVLSGGKILTGWIPWGSLWYVDGQTQQAPLNPIKCNATHPRCDFSEDVLFNNVLKTHAASLGEVVPGTFYFDYPNHRIYVGDDPTHATVETSVTPQAFTGAVTGVTISHLLIEKYAGDAIQAGDTYPAPQTWVIENNEIRFNHGTGAWNYNGDIVRGNYVHHNGCQAFGGAGKNILIENNEMAYNNTAGFDPFTGCGGAKWVYTDHLTVRGNNSHNNDGPGYWDDINNINTLYENNIADDNTRGGIFHELGYSAVIRNNTVRRNGTGRQYPGWTSGAGLEVLDAPNVEMYGNVVIDNGQGMTCLDDGRADPTTETNGPWRVVNMYVHDNVVVQMADLGPGWMRTGCLSSGTNPYAPSANNRFARDTYYLGSSEPYFMWNNADINATQWVAAGEDTDGMIYHNIAPTDLTPPLLSGISVIPFVSSVTVSWATNEPATTQVLFGPTTAYASSIPLDGALTTVHSKILSGLNANTLYHYQLWSKDAAGNLATSDDLTFTTQSSVGTPPPPPPPPPPVPQEPDAVMSGDYDGDGKTDIALWRSSDGMWHVETSASHFTASLTPVLWGQVGDIPISGDYDGDGKADIAVWRPSNGLWYILSSASGNFVTGQPVAWGQVGDIPVSGDYDGDGKTDIAVWRPSNGTWYIRSSVSGNFVTGQPMAWGVAGDIPVSGDYDGDGKTDIAVWRPSNGIWYIRSSASGYLTSQQVAWGLPGDIPVSGDYDGDGKTDIAVWRPSNGMWYIRSSASGNLLTGQPVAWGLPGDIPMSGDYDGDRKTDIAVWRPSLAMGLILSSASNFTIGLPPVQWNQMRNTLANSLTAQPATTHLANVQVYPNPWRKKTAASGVTFGRFSTATTVKIFTVSGHWVKTLPPSATSATWDLTTDNGDKVASGLYLYLMTTDTGEKKTGLLSVIR